MSVKSVLYRADFVWEWRPWCQRNNYVEQRTHKGISLGNLFLGFGFACVNLCGDVSCIYDCCVVWLFLGSIKHCLYCCSVKCCHFGLCAFCTANDGIYYHRLLYLVQTKTNIKMLLLKFWHLYKKFLFLLCFFKIFAIIYL